MSMLDGMLHRLRVLLRGEAYSAEIRRELQFHRELDELARHGNSLGNETYYREEVRSVSVLAWLDRLERNLRYALRGLRRAPGFSVTVITTIALGVGANATMFSVLDRMWLRPPTGVAAPGELHRVYIKHGYSVSRSGSALAGMMNYPTFAALSASWPTTPLVAYTGPDSLAAGDAAMLGARISYVTGNYFQVAAIRPVAGRLFGAEESRVDSPTPEIVISERLWRSAFGSERSTIGRTVHLGKLAVTIVGIAPAEFAGVATSAADAWIPLNNFVGARVRGDGPPWYQTGGNYLSAFTRFDRSTNKEELAARARLSLRDLIIPGMRHDTATVAFGPILEARGPLDESSELRLATRVGAVAAIVLLLACANVASLMLTRAARRAREIAVRQALGASRARLLEQLLTESLLLAAAGGTLAVAVSVWGGAAIQRLLFPRVYWIGGITNGRVLAFCAVLVIVVGAVAGLASAVFASGADVIASLRSGAVERGFRRSPIAAALLAVQAALCVVLLVGAGLLVRSRMNVDGINLGVDADHVVMASVPSTPDREYGPEVIPAYEQILDAMRRFPGVEAATLASSAPMSGTSFTSMFRPNGDTLNRLNGESVSFNDVGPDYFKVAGIRLIAGRPFTAGDREGAPLVVIVSRKFASLVWPAEQAIGKCLVVGKRDAPCSTVIGIVEDTHRMSVIESASLQYFRPLAQHGGFLPPMIVLRASPSRVPAVMAELRIRLSRAFPENERVNARSLMQLLDPQLRSWRIGAELFTALGVLAVIVAAVGIYSTVAYGVAQRTHEMGVRIALGADARTIIDLVVREGMAIVGIGLAIGIVAALLLGRFIASLLFGVTASDPSTMVGAVAVLGGVAIAACLFPAWRGARVDPMVALRAD